MPEIEGITSLRSMPTGLTTGIILARAMTNNGFSARSGRVLLAGGSGYIGLPLARRLTEIGRPVRIFDRLVYNHGSAALALMADTDTEFVFGDMGDVTERALDGVTDVVILAGLVGDPITKKFPRESQTINEEALRRFIDRLDRRGLNKVVFISTCSNYGMISDSEVAHEGFALNPLSLYAKAKVRAEQYLLSLEGQVDYHVTVLRFATAFGLAPRMRFDLTVNEFTRELFLGRELIVYDADTWRPYCHVRDFARLIQRVLDAPPDVVSFEVFNGGGDTNNLTKRQIVEMLLEHVPEGRVVYRQNSADRRNYRVDFSKVRERLSFEPKFDVAYGITEIIGALRSHLLSDVDARPSFYGNCELPGLANAAW